MALKIGVLTHNYPRFPGDFSGNFVEALSEELVTQGHHVTVLAPWDPAYMWLNSGRRVHLALYRYAPRSHWHRLAYMRSMKADVSLRPINYVLAPGLFAAGARTVLRWTARERPDVLHAHWAVPNGFLAALANRRYGVPLAVSIPGSDATVAAANPVFGWMARFAFHHAALITANSAALRDVVLKSLGADPAKFDLIPYGVHPGKLHPDPTGTAELRAQLGIPPDATVLLAVGRMVYKKGFDGLLEAAALLHSGPPQDRGDIVPASPLPHLVFVGEGDLWQEWQALGRSLGLAERSHWVGTVRADEIHTYYNMADILVMPAVTRPADGLNVTVLDAMACAKPVVATNAAGNELAVRDGANGFLVPEGDHPALARALATLIADPELRRLMGAEGRRRIEGDLGWPHLAARYVAHFERMAAHGKQGAKRYSHSAR